MHIYCPQHTLQALNVTGDLEYAIFHRKRLNYGVYYTAVNDYEILV